jgi:uncharacterized membrane protein YphA (DoxX/SURF4 family)
MTSTSRPLAKPRFAAFPALLFAIGLGLSLHYGHAWLRMPDYSEAEIEQSVELNLALALRRQPPATAPTGLDTQRGLIREALRDEIQQERWQIQSRVALGLILLTAGFAQMWLLRRAASR